MTEMNKNLGEKGGFTKFWRSLYGNISTRANKFWESLTKWLKFLMGPLLILIMVESGNDLGALGVFVLLLFYIAYLLWSRWDGYMMGLRTIESKIWGKPLDREYWGGKAGWKQKKLRFVWKKKK